MAELCAILVITLFWLTSSSLRLNSYSAFRFVSTCGEAYLATACISMVLIFRQEFFHPPKFLLKQPHKMSNNSPTTHSHHNAVKSDWINVGKKWSEIPPCVKQVINDSFSIPLKHAPSIFPQKTLSVKAMVAFSLPTHTSSIAAHSISPASYFLHDPPTPFTSNLLSRVRHLPMPPPLTVKALLEVGKQMVLDGFQSIKYIHLVDPVTMSQNVTTYFPLWVVTFWVDVFFHWGNVSRHWCKSLEWLQIERKQREERLQRR